MSNICEISLDNIISEKMEENLRDIQKYRNSLINIKNVEQFQWEKNKIIQGLFNIEDDIRETYQLAKSTIMVNKEINEQIEEEIEKNKDLSSRVYSLEKILESMQVDMRNISSLSEYYKDKDADNANYIKELERRLLKFKRNGNNRDNEYDSENDVGRSRIAPGSSYGYDSAINEANLNLEVKNYNSIPNQTADNANKIVYDRLNEKNIINSYFNEEIQKKEDIEKNDELPVKDIKRSEIKYIDDKPKQASTSKANRVVDIIMKLNSFDDINSILIRLFGEDIEQRLSSSDVDEEFISQIEESIKEIEELKRQEENSQLKMDSAEKPNESREEKKRLNTDQPCNSPSWTEACNDKNNQRNKQSNKQAVNNENNTDSKGDNKMHNINSYDSIINYLPKKMSHAPEYNSYGRQNETRSRHKDTFSSRRFSPPKKYENFDDSHWNICRNKSKSNSKNNTNRDMYSDIGSLNRVIADKILISNRNEECNFENSLRNYLKKGGKKSKDNSGVIFKNHTTPYGNFFDPSLQKGGRTNINTMNKSRSKSKLNTNQYKISPDSY